MKFTPYKYQVKATQFLLQKPRSFLYLDLGLGKTVIALSALKYLQKQQKIRSALIISPIRPMYKTWPDEIEKWDHLRSLKYCVLHGPDKNYTLKHNTDSDIFLVNYDGIKWLTNLMLRAKDPSKIPFDAIVYDESSAFKSNATKRFKRMKRVSHFFDYRYGLTGTPAPNTLLDIWPQFLLVDNGKRLGTSYSYYRDRFFNQLDFNGNKWDLKYGAKKIIIKNVSDIVLRMRAEDYLDMPELIHREIKIDLPEELKDRYKQLEREFFLQLELGEVTAFNSASLSSKLRQFISGGIYTEHPNWEQIHAIKAEELKILKDLYSEPTIIAIQFRFEYDILCKVFKQNLPVIYGGISNKISNDLIDQWNSGKLNMLIVHPQSISHGLNLQHGGSHIMWLSLPWSYEQYKQLIGRLYRQGQKKHVIVHHMLFEKTIDMRVYRALTQKHENEKSFLNNLLSTIKKED